MRFFVGTMESGETDWPKCQTAIAKQKDVTLLHHVVSGLSEQDAHRSLYETWNSQKKDFDLFLKVDADTVLCHDHVLAEIEQLFKNDVDLSGIQAYLHDYMTDSLIYGLACIRNTVTVNPNVSKLYPDRVDSGHVKVIRGHDLPESLDPAGNHCHYASEYQAFRFGVHRRLKNQTDIFARVHIAWQKNGFDRIRGMALAGFRLASTCPETDYVDERFHQIFLQTQKQLDYLMEEFK